MKATIRYSIICISTFIVVSLVVFSCRKPNQPPIAQLVAFPSIGDTSILFEFNAAGSEDDRNYPIGLMFRWDLDGDGEWDTGFAHNHLINHRYKQRGNYSVAVEVMDLDGLTSVAKDSVEVFGMNRDIDTLYDNRDGNRYQIVKIRDRWWMAENLRYGIEIPASLEQTNNDTIEIYRDLASHSPDTTGGIYSWLEALNYRVKEPKGICPDGWHIPTDKEWVSLFSPYPNLYSLQYYGEEGLSKLNLDLINGGIRIDGDFFWSQNQPSFSGFWSSSSRTKESEYLPFCVYFNSTKYKELACFFWENTGLDRYYSVRCIKDY